MTEKAVSEHEAALLARVAELEAKVANVGEPQRGGNVVEQLWRYVLAFVPRSIIGAGIAVFAAFHGWQWYIEAQGLAVETRLKTAKAAVEKAKADAANTQAGDISVRVASFRAEIEKKKQEAARTKIELDAQNSVVDNESLKVQAIRAEVAKKQAEAAKARVAADAAMQREGLQTLEEKAAKTKLMYTELDAIHKNVQGIWLQAIEQPGGRVRLMNAACSNAYADLFGCPDAYVRRFRGPEGSAASSPPRSVPSPAAVNAAPAERYSAVVPVELKMRSCPEFAARCPESGRLQKGNRVKIVRDAGNGWVEIEIRPGERGFVNGKFLAAE